MYGMTFLPCQVLPAQDCFLFVKKQNHKKCRQNREGHHDDECGKRVGVSVLIKKTRKTPPPKKKGKKSSQFLSGYISLAPWNLGPISISFMFNLSLYGNSLTHSLPNSSSSSSSSSSSLSHPSPATILDSMETPSQPWQSHRHQQQQQH